MFMMLWQFISNLISQIFLGGYVGGGISFPKPLSPKDEKKYLELAKSGDMEARNKLVEHNLRLVAHIVKKYEPSFGADSEDLISIGTIGLIKAIESFDVSKGIRLATYASKCIANEILMVIRAGKKESKEISLNDPLGTDSEGNTISLLNIMSSADEDIADSVSLKMQVKKMYEVIGQVLSSRERLVINLRYGLCGHCVKTQREIAKLLGISRSYVSRIETKALAKLNAAMQDEI